ncbi:uncharacterized protein LOC124554669 isoform X4 [Schistocerca americana]|uniref:uncharacterized protein LOC124554669 isoform X4 n=1 Tax=Schistocerca americana TaxID=7009 RepID=UPI001F4F5BDD|nr:uncharacterized protein LOC124554669 isoform X4 [Schistocerca americana]
MPKVKERKLCNKQDTPLLTTDKTKNGKKEMERQIENKKNKLHSFEEPNNKRGSEIQRPEGLCSIQEMTVELKERTKEDELMRSSRKETSSTKIRKTSKLKKEGHFSSPLSGCTTTMPGLCKTMIRLGITSMGMTPGCTCLSQH